MSERKWKNQILRDIEWKVWKVVEHMSQDQKFKEAKFNLRNYEVFVKEDIVQNVRLDGNVIILVSEECSAMINQEEVEVPKKKKDPRSCTF